MQLPSLNEWLIVGPMGPQVPNNLSHLPVLAVDGGAEFCTKIEAWIGDGDSFKGEPNCSQVFKHPPEKDQSDLALAFALFKNRVVSLHLWGFVGGRSDHEILNYGEALHFLEINPSSEIIFYNQMGNRHAKCFGPGLWHFDHHGLFSVISIKNIEIKLTGACSYEIASPTELAPLSSLGLSNVGQGVINLQCDGSVIVLFPESP